MKRLLTILGIILVGLAGSCEELPGKDYKKPLNPTDNPVYYKYMEDYQKQLYDAFNPRKFLYHGWGTAYEYTIHKDGTISDMKLYHNENKRFNAYVESVILDNPPKPFYEGMDIEQMRINTMLLQNDDDDDMRIDYFAYKNLFTNRIFKDYRKRK